jgi:hypothetical protein
VPEPVARPAQRVRWGAVWASTLTAVALYLVLQSLFFALGWFDFAVDTGNTAITRGVVSGILGIVAFFIGGPPPGTASLRAGGTGGLLHGVPSPSWPDNCARPTSRSTPRSPPSAPPPSRT